MTNKITLEQISYANPKHRNILTSCLQNWFSNPRDLNFTDPRMTYPFDFRQWIRLAYSGDDTETWVLKKDNWIIGYFSLLFPPELKAATMFHVFIAPDFRRRGLGKTLIKYAEKSSLLNEYTSLRLKVNPKNENACRLYESTGFIHIKTLPGKTLLLEKKQLGTNN